MQKLLIAVLSILFISLQGQAQVRYDTCQYTHRFDGEWEYANGADTIRVCLRAQRDYYANFNSIDDVIYGWHEYKKGNLIIESNYENRFMPVIVDTFSKRSVSIGLRMRKGIECDPNQIIAYGSICDYHQANETKMVTVSLDATGTVMTWKQKHAEWYGAFTGAFGMTLPKEFVLIKQ